MKTMMKFTIALCIGSVVSAALIAGFVYFVCMLAGSVPSAEAVELTSGLGGFLCGFIVAFVVAAEGVHF